MAESDVFGSMEEPVVDVEHRDTWDRTILVWSFWDAPESLRKLSGHGGDEDWLAIVPADYPHYIGWLERGPFGVCDISEHKLPDGRTVYIGAHA